MKLKEIRKASDAQLQEQLSSLKKELFNLRFQHATNQLDNPMKLAEVKKEIARVKTVIRENEIKAEKTV